MSFLGLVLFSSWVMAFAQPDWSITPGFFCTESDSSFDRYDYPDHVARCKRHVPVDEKWKVAHFYGDIPREEWSHYEFDHLLPLCAGGSNDIRNIWPQPLDEAHQKDVLEKDICIGLKGGNLTQTQAIQRIRDWFTAMAENRGKQAK